METFSIGKTILEETIENQKWVFKVKDIYNPSPTEIEQNEAYNDTLGNYEPDKELPTTPSVELVAINQNGEKVEMWWGPCGKHLGPHVSKKGWSKSLFTKLKGKLLKHKLPA
jgi:hypothetical protein